MTKTGIREESVDKLAESILPFVEQYEERYGTDGVPLWKLNEVWDDDVSSRHMRQAVVRNLRRGEMYRTRVDRKSPELYTGRLVDPAVTTKGPGRDMTEGLEIKEFEKSDIEGFSEEYRIYQELGSIENPDESKYGTPKYFFFSDLVMDHMQRHEDVDFWIEDKKENVERAEVSWCLKGVDPESRRKEREIKYIVESKNSETIIKAEFTTRKFKYEDENREIEFWGLDPLNAKGYMGKLLDFTDKSRFSVLKERAKEIEKWSEMAADMIVDEESEYELKDFFGNMEAYKSYFSDEVQDSDPFRSKDRDRIPLTSDPLIVELDKEYIHNIKDHRIEGEGGKEFSPTKKKCLKDSLTAEKDFKAPIRKFLELLEETTELKVESEYKE